jgi:hypothetical protein
MNDNSKISTLTNELTAADLAAADLFPAVDTSAVETKRMQAMAAALGLSKLLFFEDTGDDDAYVISTGLSLTALTKGFSFALKPTTANTGACTLTVDSANAVAIKVVDGGGTRDPLTGEIAAGMTALFSYNGTYFILLNPLSNQISFEAIITQSGTDAPVVDAIIKNQLCDTFTWSRFDTGIYYATSATNLQGSMVTRPSGIIVSTTAIVGYWSIVNSGAKQLRLYTYNQAGNASDDILYLTPIHFAKLI